MIIKCDRMTKSPPVIIADGSADLDVLLDAVAKVLAQMYREEVQNEKADKID